MSLRKCLSQCGHGVARLQSAVPRVQIAICRLSRGHRMQKEESWVGIILSLARGSR